MESGLVEPTSFAYMRGDTHEPDAFVIADEMQFKQLAGLCERYGGGKMCIMGDPRSGRLQEGTLGVWALRIAVRQICAED